MKDGIDCNDVNVIMIVFLKYCLAILFYIFIYLAHIHTYSQSETVQRRLHKSLKLWSMYADLEESLGTFQVRLKTTNRGHKKILLSSPLFKTFKILKL